MVNLLCFLIMGTRLIYLNAEALSTAPWYSRVQADGSFLICSEKKVTHFDRDGQLIRVLEGRGRGPEALEKVTNVVFDGDHYYVSDKANLSVTLYDQQGRFQNKQTLYCWNLLTANRQLFMVDLRALHPAREQPYALVRLTLDNNLNLAEHERFYPTSKLAQDLDFAFKFHTIAFVNGNYYVMDELSNVLTQFSPTFKKIKTLRAPLPGYVPPACCPPTGGYEQSRTYLYSHSYIHHIAPLGQNIAISYSIPNPDNLYQTRRRVQIVSPEGKAIGPPLDQMGTFIGSYQQELFFIQEGDEFISELTAWSR